MTPNDWAYIVLFLLFLGFGTYALVRALDERDMTRAHRRQMVEDQYWADLMRAVNRARHDIDA